MLKLTRYLILLLILLLSACTTVGPKGGTTTPTREIDVAENEAAEIVATITPELSRTLPSFTPTATVTIQGPTPTLPPATYFQFERGINPLTGLPVVEQENLDRRPVMVKISNWPREGRPHAGLTRADMVFEYFIGHQMNRFLAVYYGTDSDVIGPVRSGRLVDAQLVNFYQGILGYGDADPQVDEVLIEVLGNRAIGFIGTPCPAMCGEATHSATGVYANSSALLEFAVSQGVDNQPPDLRGMYFEEDFDSMDAAGSLLHVEYADFSVMQWRYEPLAGKYHLWMEAELEDRLDLAPMTDRNSGASVLFDNIIVMYAEYIEYAPSLHDVVLNGATGYQPALLFRDGGVVYGLWRTPEPDRPIIFETPENEPMPLKPGKTWVVIVGMNSQTSQLPGGEWEIYFDLP